MAFGLSIKIGADISELKKELNNAGGALDKFAKSIGPSITRLAKFSAAAVAAGTAIGTVMVKQSMSSVDALGKMSDQIGIGTEKLIALRLAASETAGVADGQMDTALRRMTRRIEEAAQGTGAAASALRNMGLDAQQLSKLTPDEQFLRLADAMQKTQSQSQKLQNTMAIFDTEGMPLVNTLSKGAEALREFEHRAEQMGRSLSRIDAAEVEAANIELSRVSQSVRGVADQLAVRLAPFVGEAAKQFVALSQDAGAALDRIGSAARMTIQVVGVLADAVAITGLRFRQTADVAVPAIKQIIGEHDRWRERIESVHKVQFNLLKLWTRFWKIPGVDLSPFQAMEFEDLRDGLPKAMESAKEQIRKSMDDIRDELGGELPSEGIDQWLARVQESSRQAAEAAVAAMSGGMTDSPGVSGAGDEKLHEELQKRLEAIRVANQTEVEAEAEKHAKNLETLNEAFANELMTTEQWHEALEAERQRHDQKLSEIDKKGWTEREKFAAMSLGRQAAHISGELSSIFGAMSNHNDKMFNMSKIASAGNAFVATLAGQAEALKLGWPLGPIAAAKIGAAGFGFISAIKGAGKGGATVGSAVTADLSQASLPAPQQPQPERLIRVESISPDALINVRSLAEALEELAEDGHTRIVIA